MQGKGSRAGPLGPTGGLLIDKPLGLTSRHAVSEAARRLGVEGAGHCGTIDSTATGLLVFVVGGATRVQDILLRAEKTYRAIVRFGIETDTDDAAGRTLCEHPVDRLRKEELSAILPRFLGRQLQVPPRYSAIHQPKGQRAWHLAQRGEAPDFAPREVTVHAIEILSLHGADAELEIRCGAGTYVRALARDLGRAMGTGAHVAALRRLRCGDFDVADARPLAAIGCDDLIPLERLLASVPKVEIDPDDLDALLDGKAARVLGPEPEIPEPIIWCAGRVIARGRPLGGGRVRIRRIISDPRDRSTRSATVRPADPRPGNGRQAQRGPDDDTVSPPSAGGA